MFNNQKPTDMTEQNSVQQTMHDKIGDEQVERSLPQNDGADRSGLKKTAVFGGVSLALLMLVLGVIGFSGSDSPSDKEKPPLPEDMVSNRNQKNLDAEKNKIAEDIARAEAERAAAYTAAQEQPPGGQPSDSTDAPPPAPAKDGGQREAPPQEDLRLQGNVLVAFNAANPAAQPQTAAQTATEGNTAQATAAGSPKAFMRGVADFLLRKGTNISCTLDTKIVTEHPGLTRCLINRDVYSANGKTLLLERGSFAVGAQTGALIHGQARVFVVWNEIETPNGVRIQLNAPSSDDLGASGQPAHVDTHFWERFGGAIMLSLIGDFGDALSARMARHSATEIRFDNTSDAAEDMAAQALKNSINIPPTGIVQQGARLNIMVVQDVDFSDVYETVRLPARY